MKRPAWYSEEGICTSTDPIILAANKAFIAWVRDLVKAGKTDKKNHRILHVRPEDVDDLFLETMRAIGKIP